MYGREKEVWIDNQPEEYTLSMALAAGYLEDIWDMIDAHASEDEMLSKGYDPDMVNEYCCDSVQDWSSVDALYGPQDAALIALKKKRAEKILKKEDPGVLSPEEKKIATVIPHPENTPNAQPAASQTKQAAPKAKQATSTVKAGRTPIPPQKEQPVGDPSKGKKLGIFDYVALYKMSLRSFFWRADGRQGMNGLRTGGDITSALWIISGLICYGLPIIFLYGIIGFVQMLLMKPLALINPILASSAGMQPGAYLGILAMSAFLFLLCSPVVVNKDRLFYNLKFKDSAWWRNTGITPREISKDKGLYGEYIATMAAELNMKKYGLHGRVFNSVIVPKADGNFNEVDLVCVNETGIHVIEAKARGGTFLGGLTDQKWVQNIGKKSYNMTNPLFQNTGHINALTEYLFDKLPNGSARTKASFPYSYINIVLMGTSDCDTSNLDGTVTPAQFFLGATEGSNGYRNLDLKKMYKARLSKKEVDQICAVLETISGYSHGQVQAKILRREEEKHHGKYCYDYWYSIVRLESVTADGETEMNDLICLEQCRPIPTKPCSEPTWTLLTACSRRSPIPVLSAAAKPNTRTWNRPGAIIIPSWPAKTTKKEEAKTASSLLIGFSIEDNRNLFALILQNGGLCLVNFGFFLHRLSRLLCSRFFLFRLRFLHRAADGAEPGIRFNAGAALAASLSCGGRTAAGDLADLLLNLGLQLVQGFRIGDLVLDIGLQILELLGFVHLLNAIHGQLAYLFGAVENYLGRFRAHHHFVKQTAHKNTSLFFLRWIYSSIFWKKIQDQKKF